MALFMAQAKEVDIIITTALIRTFTMFVWTLTGQLEDPRPA